jgi:hypothetical protein
MRFRNILMTVPGLVALAAGIMYAIQAVYGQTLIVQLLRGGTAVTFALLAFECFHYGLSRPEGDYRFFSRGLRGLCLDAANLFLAAGLMLASITFQRSSDPLCGGNPGAGFPLAFLCDKTGESPIGDWGIMSWSDIPQPLGVFVNILFYVGLLWSILLTAYWFIQQSHKQRQIRL